MDRANLALRRLLKHSLGALALVVAPAVLASGDGEMWDPLPRAAPLAAMSKFAAGQVGVLDSSFQRGYLVVAWRVLARQPLSDAELGMLRAALPDEPRYNSAQGWNAALKAAGGTPAAPAHDDWSRSVDVTVNGQRTFMQFDNCNASTESTAIETLNARIAAHGAIAVNPWVAEWARGQAAVLANCGGSAEIPKRLGPDSPDWVRQDRDYQRAAALFYSMQYDKARDEFEQVAADASSPWSEFGLYLAARSMLRAASLSVTAAEHKRLAIDARDRFDAVARSGTPRVREWALQLRSRAALEADPDATLAQASTVLDRASWGVDGQRGLDVVLAQPALAPTASAHGNLVEWLSLVAQAPSARPAQWASPAPSKGAPQADLSAPRRRACALALDPVADNPVAWAAACLMLAQDAGDAPAAVLAQARKLPATHPAHATLGYYAFQARMRALARLGDEPRAAARQELRTDIDFAISHEAALYGVDGVNALRLLRVPLATDGAALLRDTRLQGVSGYVAQAAWKSEAGRDADQKDVVDPLRGEIVDSMLSVNALERLSAEPGVSADDSRGLLLKAWLRSALLGQVERQKALAAVLGQRVPTLRAAVASVQDAQSPEQARYEWTSLAYRRPDEFANASVGMDVSTAASGQPPALLAWLRPQEVAERAAETRAKPAMPVDNETRGDAVIAWARSHPKDPRLAGDLASVVTQWKYSYHPEGSPQHVPQSREAFVLLHKLFPRSDEAQKTKYFY